MKSFRTDTDLFPGPLAWAVVCCGRILVWGDSRGREQVEVFWCRRDARNARDEWQRNASDGDKRRYYVVRVRISSVSGLSLMNRLDLR